MMNNSEFYSPFVSDCAWDLKDVIKVLLFYLFLVFIGTPALLQFSNYIIGKDLVRSFGENSVIILLSLFANTLPCLYIFYIICIEYKHPLISLGLTLVDWKKNVLEGIKKYVIALPFLITAGLVTDFVCKLTGSSPQQQEITKRVLEENSLYVLVLMIVFGTFAAPVIEEILFRGFLQTFLHKYLGRWKAILISSIFFSLVHMNIQVFIQILFLGILLAYVFEKTKSLVATITIHSIHNSATFAILFIFKETL